MPSNGGGLEGWRVALNAADYDAVRNTAPGMQYGVRRDAIGRPDWTLSPAGGDVVIFRNSEIHAVQCSAEHRATWGFFLGYRDGDKPLLMWS
jgi:hypothetical protein